MKLSQLHSIGRWILGGVILLGLTTSIAMADVVYSTHACLSTESGSTSVDVKDVLDGLLDTWYPIKGDSLPVLIQFYDSLNRPQPEVPCTLTVGSSKYAQSSDKNGEVLFWVREEDAGENIMCNAYPDHPVEAYYLVFVSVGTQMDMFASKKAYFLTAAGMLELRDGGVRVLYPEGYEEKARQMLDIFTTEKKIIESAVGIKLLPFKAILRDSTSTGISVGGYGLSLTRSGNYTDLETYAYFPHEWVETSLRYNYHIYEDTTNLCRWIGDGLANYAAVEICKQLYPLYLQQLGAGINKYRESEQIYDLLDRSAVGYKRYALAPYFWAKVVRKSGNPEIIPEFLEEFQRLEDHTSQNAVALLSRLSGLDIRKELVITGQEYIENVSRYWPIPIPPEGMNLVIYVESFSMGDTSLEFASPVRKVQDVGCIFIDRYEVTNREFCEFLNASGNRKEHGAHWLDEKNYPEIEHLKGQYQAKPDYENYPVRWVTWFGARAYARWAGKRLLTEAEWELSGSNYGTTRYPWSATPLNEEWHDDYCNWGDGGELDGFELTAPVDTFPMSKNHDDCLNMVGNVSEWVVDWYAPYSPADTINPKGPQTGTQKAYRGGSFADGKEWMTTRARQGADPAQASPYIGFRCAMDIPKTEGN